MLPAAPPPNVDYALDALGLPLRGPLDEVDGTAKGASKLYRGSLRRTRGGHAPTGTAKTTSEGDGDPKL
jgi:hypothetical protein